ncbi:MAG: sterol desaturase family protein [Myxococcales bacterium]
MGYPAAVRLSLAAIPLFILAMFGEHWLARRKGRTLHERRDTTTSISMGLGSLAFGGLYRLAFVGITFAVYEHRVFTVTSSALAWCVALVARDFCYYWAHRMDHEHRFMWAAHVTHHSSRRMHFATAVRQSWTQPLVNRWFELPLAFLGFHPLLIASHAGISAVYQFLIHTEQVGKLGPFEWVFNTPSHHRVHHASNVAYLDRNHGGILILWDRLFGTFAEERDDEPVVYGLTKNIDSYNPLTVAFHEWIALWRDLRREPSLGEKLRVFWRAPGYSSDGSSLTADQMRARARVTSLEAS